MGATTSTPVPAVATETPVVAKPVEEASKVNASACPMGFGKKSSSGNDSDRCPVKNSKSAEKYKNPDVFNVYSQKIDPTNNMPSVANQQPSKDQMVPISTERVSSTIPKGGTDNETWLYPSPQMFWNALVRKNKSDGVAEKDMDTVIAIHNNMNENTWHQVMQWENMHDVKEAGKEPKLLRFIGRPDEHSPKARLKMLFGHPEPFDRHDWVVDRGGTEVRYVIDYYHDESAVKQDQRPKGLHDAQSMKSIQVDVRPALDSVGAIFDRIIGMPLRQMRKATEYNPPPFFAPPKMITAEVNKVEEMGNQWRDIQTKCDSFRLKLENCQSDQECSAASVALQRCTASVVCPSVVADFDACVNAKPNDFEKTSIAYNVMVKCLEMFEIESRKILAKPK